MDRQSQESAQARQALDELFSVTYEELRRLASTVKGKDPSATLNPTALVNEAWLKLAKSPGFETTSPLHFKRIAARAMRQVLVEAARRRHSHKRGGSGEAIFVPLDDAGEPGTSAGEDVLALEEALRELEAIDPRQALLVESRFYGGLDAAEIAELLAVSEITVHRDWRAVKAWLVHKLRG
ncbi:MAG TPA: ECF-type sigma factor [Bryobacteraceae bacterium]|jgi:RNA polymerase sigma factor (TIGR02999 family)